MKDKKAVQIAQKQRHKAELKAAKSRREAPVLILDQPTRVEKLRILIVCEGANTEPSYFRKFRLTSADILPLEAVLKPLAGRKVAPFAAIFRFIFSE